MNWAQLAELMHAEMSKLLQEHICSLRSLSLQLDQVPRTLAALDSKSGPIIDAAVLDFAAERTWPVLPPKHKTMLYYRLEFAYMTASLLSTAHTICGRRLFTHPGKDFTDVDLIEWLLITAWREEGIKLLHSTCADMLSEDAQPTDPVFGNN